MRHDQNGSVDVQEKQKEWGEEVAVVLKQRGRPDKEATARMSYGMAREMENGREG